MPFTFYYTLVVLGFVAAAAATCLSGYFVSRRKSFAFGAAMFAFYFFDISIVFFHDFMAMGGQTSANTLYDIQFPAVSVITGAGTIETLWLLVSEKLNNDYLNNKVALVAPIVLYVVLSAAAYLLIGDLRLRALLFFSVRQLFLFFIFISYFAWYFRTDAKDRKKIRPKPFDIAVACVLTVGILVEDILVMFPLEQSIVANRGVFEFFAERSLFENLLFIWLGIMLIRDVWKTARSHYSNPPSGNSDKSITTIETMLPRYADLHGLTAREREVLHMILLGKDNNNIANELTLTVGTVKVHIHNILKKTGKANRQEVIQDFWRMR